MSPRERSARTSARGLQGGAPVIARTNGSGPSSLAQMKRPNGGRRVVAVVATSVLVLLVAACGGQATPNAGRTGTSTSTVPGTSAGSGTSSGKASARLTKERRSHSKKRPADLGRARRGQYPGRLQNATRILRHRAALLAQLPPRCPLTGTLAPKGKAPDRPAVAVKVENLPEARPQWGLDKADIVFEEPVEGGITRFIAVFQCQAADRIEPVRSGRLVDPQILEPLGRILFGYSGAIQPAINEVDSKRSLLFDVGADRAGGSYYRDPDRYAPHNLVTSTSALYAAASALGDRDEKGPTPIFAYGRPSRGARRQPRSTSTTRSTSPLGPGTRGPGSITGRTQTRARPCRATAPR